MGATMRIRTFLASLALVMCCLAPPGAARTAGPPRNPAAFTEYVAGLLRQAAPDVKIKVTGPLTLDVDGPGGPHTAMLDNMFDTCRRDRAGCEQTVAVYVSQMTTLWRTPPKPLVVSQLRVIVRPSAYVQSMRQDMRGAEPVAKPLIGDLWVIGAADQPTAIDLLTSQNLAPLNLTAEQAMARGRKNMRFAMLRLLKPALAASRDQIAGLTGDPYESSLLAFPELWAKVAEVEGGNLIVSVPARDVVLLTDGSGAHAVADLKQAAEQVMATADRPFSSAVYRWSADGWTPVQPGSANAPATAGTPAADADGQDPPRRTHRPRRPRHPDAAPDTSVESVATESRLESVGV